MVMAKLTQTRKMPRSLAMATASATAGTTASPPATSIGLRIAGSTKSFWMEPPIPANTKPLESRINSIKKPKQLPPRDVEREGEETDLHVDNEHGRLAPLGGRHGPPRFGGNPRDGGAAAAAGEPAALQVVEEELVEGEEQYQQARQQRQM